MKSTQIGGKQHCYGFENITYKTSHYDGICSGVSDVVPVYGGVCVWVGRSLEHNPWSTESMVLSWFAPFGTTWTPRRVRESGSVRSSSWLIVRDWRFVRAKWRVVSVFPFWKAWRFLWWTITTLTGTGVGTFPILLECCPSKQCCVPVLKGILEVICGIYRYILEVISEGEFYEFGGSRGDLPVFSKLSRWDLLLLDFTGRFRQVWSPFRKVSAGLE